MSKFSIDSTTLTSIGNAIRTKEGSNDTILVSNMANRILNLSEGVNFTEPYNCNISFSTLLPEDLQQISSIRIPYEIWNQYDSISFNYAINSERRPTHGSNGSYVNLFIQMGELSSANTWSTTTRSIYPDGPKEYVVQNFSGAISDVCTIDCSNRNIYVNAYNHEYPDIIIELEVKRYASSDTSSYCGLQLGNFSGVRK